MKYMNNINKIKAIGMAALVGMTTVSCDLDLLPLNEVVLENYWKEEADVQSVVNSCYVGMAAEGYVDKLLTWGELRSDNVTNGTDVPDNIKQMMMGNILETNPVTDWGAIYNVINRCNTVVYYAPEVAATDPNYTEQDLYKNLAEVKTLRALSYFYLIRTFRDVPFSFEPSIDDFQDYRIPATKHEEILDAIIKDIEDPQVIQFAPLMTSTLRNSTGLITRPAVWALLADLYLWKASNAALPQGEQTAAYKKCVDYCDQILAFKDQQLERADYRTYNQQMDSEVKRTYGYSLIANSEPSISEAAAFLFDSGNSIESIFELTYDAGATAVHNTAVHYMYGGADKDMKFIRKIAANDLLMPTVPTDKYEVGKLFPVYTDYRSISSFTYASGASSSIIKYVANSITSSTVKIGPQWSGMPSSTIDSWVQTKSPDDADMNWIIYRLTDVMLMRAEAEINLANLMAAVPNAAGEGITSTKRVLGSSITTAEGYYQDAFNLIMAVYMRSNPDATATQCPDYANYKTYEELMNLLEMERQREFLFEGKRYYDLVRRARREGNNQHFVTSIRNKFAEAPQAVLIKMLMPDFMYMPYSGTQIDVNPNLVQNPAYAQSDELIKN